MFRRPRLAVVASFVLLALPAVGCAASQEDADAQDPASSEAAMTSCGAAAYSRALVHYKAAVAKAKQRRVDACMEDSSGGSGTLFEIDEAASKAVSTCAAFRQVIKMSPWAAPVRTALESNLAYPILVGDADLETGRGLAEALEKNVTVYGMASGAYGNVSRLEFSAGGRGVMAMMHMTDDGEVYWGRTDMRWSVSTEGGAVAIKVTAEYEDETEKVFEFRVGKSEWGETQLQLQNDPDAPTGLQSFVIHPSECDA